MTVPLPVIFPVNVLVPTPPKVNAKALLVTALVALFKIKSSASTFILAADCKFMFPLIVFVPDTLLIAPSELTPPPLILIVASDTVILFCNCKAALFATVVPPSVAPNASLF